MNVKDLQNLARLCNIKGRSKMRKAELQSVLLEIIGKSRAINFGSKGNILRLRVSCEGKKGMAIWRAV